MAGNVTYVIKTTASGLQKATGVDFDPEVKLLIAVIAIIVVAGAGYLMGKKKK